jgi:hypothetical protein
LGEHEFSGDVPLASFGGEDPRSLPWKVLTCANRAIGNVDAVKDAPGSCSKLEGIYKLGD